MMKQISIFTKQNLPFSLEPLTVQKYLSQQIFLWGKTVISNENSSAFVLLETKDEMHQNCKLYRALKSPT